MFRSRAERLPKNRWKWLGNSERLDLVQAKRYLHDAENGDEIVNLAKIGSQDVCTNYNSMFSGITQQHHLIKKEQFRHLKFFL